jgi:hypothetical protein
LNPNRCALILPAAGLGASGTGGRTPTRAGGFGFTPGRARAPVTSPLTGGLPERSGDFEPESESGVELDLCCVTLIPLYSLRVVRTGFPIDRPFVSSCRT